jgi:hypothetical protein
MGEPAPASARAELRAWIAKLETDRAWTARMRAELAARACEPCDLVLVLAPAAEFPRSAGRFPRVGDYLAIVGSVSELMDCAIPVVNLADVRARDPRDHAHALLIEQALGTAFRFRLPRD